MTFTTSTNGPEATRRLGQTIGRLLNGGEIVELLGDVGSGKTTLTQGIVAGMGFKEEVPSPTFTLSRAYPVREDITLYHFDFYRLGGHDIVTDELDEVAGDVRAVVVVEWAGNGAVKLPQQRLQISLTPGIHDEERDITIKGIGPQAEQIVTRVQHDYHA